MDADYLIVGAGLTGGVIARQLVDRGLDVLVLERRSHLGGNVHDYEHRSGIRVHTYGPHFFRTSSERIWLFARRFAAFYPYVHEVRSLVDGRFEPWPITTGVVRGAAGPSWQPHSATGASNFEEAVLAKMPRSVYEKYVRGYTEKQWGVPATTLEATLAQRMGVRADGDRRFTTKRYQGLPVEGYTAWIERLFQGIRVVRDCDYLEQGGAFSARKLLVYTGAIDALFGYDLGHLAYRAQRRESHFVAERDWVLPTAVVNNPNPEAGLHVRTIEWKHMMPAEAALSVRGSLLTREIPYTPTDPNALEYPFPDAANRALYARYRVRARRIPRLLVCGRLGEYRYYDMDQAIARALTLSRRILDRTGAQDRPFDQSDSLRT